MGKAGTPEDAFSFGDIQDLVLVEDSSVFFGKKVPGGMPGGWIGLAGPDVLGSNGIDGQPPQEVVPVDDQVFQVDVFFYDRLIWLGASPKCFLNSRENVEGEEAPTLSATSLTVHSPDRSN